MFWLDLFLMFLRFLQKTLPLNVCFLCSFKQDKQLCVAEINVDWFILAFFVHHKNAAAHVQNS